MWRSNVLRLRKCSSAAAWRNTRWSSSQTSLPITKEEFNEALRRIDKDNWWIRSEINPKVRKLGFAISGGVDSMALAALYANLRPSQQYTCHGMTLAERRANLRSSQQDKVPAHAFIVDHKVRPESTEEAEWVAEQCRSKFGMEATVLPLSWPADFDPLDHKRFETDARALRYQALGRACRAANIDNLMVAHHADDQAETVLMRLANNRLRSGLQAMQPIEWIPECFGMHGVSHSGAVYKNYDNPRLEHMPFPVERGGVRIWRPLLSFDKARLMATCEEHGVAWVEDKTNHLQTYTSRNAIRHVLKNHKLPAALSIKSLVGMSLDMQRRVSWHKFHAHRLLIQCNMQLDLRAGSLHITFPPFRELLERPILTQSDLNEVRNNAVYLLAQVGRFIAPRETPPMGELAATIGNIWPEFLKFEETDPFKARFTGNMTNYCIYGIWWRKCKPSPVSSRIHKPRGFRDLEWFLMRQPLEHHRPDATSTNINYPPSHVLPLTQDRPLTLTGGEIKGYQLFDGRWWINIQNHSVDALTLRLLSKEDLARIPPLHNTERSGPERFISAALKLLKPADLRSTLPAVFRRDAVTGEETLVGLPTLDVSMGQLGSPKDVCSWQVHYKKVELDMRNLGAAVVPGITHAMIEKELANANTTAENMKKELVKFDKSAKKTEENLAKHDTTVNKVEKALAKNIAKMKGTERAVEGAAVRSRRQKSQATKPDTVAKTGRFGRTNTNQGKTVPLIPVTESKRRGQSEKREGGGYNIQWEDFKDRF